jgi:hypothetical protein
MEQELRIRVLGAAELAVSGRPLVELASAKAAALTVYWRSQVRGEWWPASC